MYFLNCYLFFKECESLSFSLDFNEGVNMFEFDLKSVINLKRRAINIFFVIH